MLRMKNLDSSNSFELEAGGTFEGPRGRKKFL